MPRYDLVIGNATIVDGTRAPRFRADVAIRNGRIERIGSVGKEPSDRIIDASGKILAPGFIDAHTHDDRLMLSGPDMAPKVSQGVTTVIAGNCGISLAPALRGMPRQVPPPLDLLDDEGSWFRFRTFEQYIQELRNKPAATNCALLVGHSMLRVQTMDDLDKPASSGQIAQMQTLVEEALEAGALGPPTGPYYPPARAAATEEVIEVCRPLSARNALYCTHMRSEGDGVVDALEETFRIGRELAVPVVVSHHKVLGIPNYGRSAETLPIIEKAMRSQKIGLDCYPYHASSTILSWNRVGIASRVLVAWSRPHPELSGMDLKDIARQMNLPEEKAVQKLLPAGAIYFSMDETDVQRILAFERTMIGSDGLPHDAAPHPRLWGTFGRVLGHYRRLGLFSLEDAVHKMTGLTAETFGLADRGAGKEGFAADLVLSDAAPSGAAGAGGSLEARIAPRRGMKRVIGNGEPVWHEGRPTGARPGHVLTRVSP